MNDFSDEQRGVLSEFFSNVAVGWFLIGVVTPFFDLSRIGLGSYVTMVWGFTMSGMFLYIALLIRK